MKLVLDGPQQMLANTAAELTAKHAPVDRLRALRDAGSELGFSPEVWGEMIELGWTAIPFAESDGGLGMGMAEVVLVTEALGRALAPEPFLSDVVLAGRVLANGAGETLRADWLSPLVEGVKRFTVAHHEPGARYALGVIDARAESAPGRDGWTLSGRKAHVLDGYRADGWIVPARTSGERADTEGVTLFAVPAETAGVRVEREWRIDSRNAATLELDRVELPAAAVLGEVGRGHDLLRDAVDAATVALCGEMVGAMATIFERTLDYLRTREQFGVPIGSFQALQHRAAKMFIELELSRSAVMAAARALDAGDERAAAWTSNAKARCSDAYILIANEALQMHGGIGMTDEHDAGLFLKHARACELTFGDAAHHRDRFARLGGY